MRKLVVCLHWSLSFCNSQESWVMVGLRYFQCMKKETLIARVPDPGWPACRLPVTCSPDDVRWITTDSNDK